MKMPVHRLISPYTCVHPWGVFAAVQSGLLQTSQSFQKRRPVAVWLCLVAHGQAWRMNNSVRWCLSSILSQPHPVTLGAL